MPPSDSDDEAPAGGYYVVEPVRKAPAPKVDIQAPPVEPSLIPKPPPAPVSNDLMDPSDSDEEAPPGGYEVRVSDPAKARAAFLARASKARPASPASSIARRRTLPSGHTTGWRSRTRGTGVKEAP